MNSLDVDRIVLGCGNFGGVGSVPSLIGQGETVEQAFALLDEAISLGIYQFDTANSYAGGRSEEMIGHWASKQSASIRQKIRISTKVGNPAVTPVGETPLSANEIDQHLTASLKRLNVEQLDTYYVHEPDSKTPIEETLTAFERAIKSGSVASIGLSNVTVNYVQDFLQKCDTFLKEKVRYVQNEYHFLNQTDRNQLMPFLKSVNMKYVAFGPLAGGLLTGKYQAHAQPPKGSRLDLRIDPYVKYLNSTISSVIDQFTAAAADRKITPAAAAIEFVLQEKGIHSVIIGPRRKEHFEHLGFKRE